MRILVTGAYGLIGTYVTLRLLAEGHELIGIGRDTSAARRRLPNVRWVDADLALASVADWMPLLGDVDAIVNCAGALQDNPRDDLRAVHVDGVQRLIDAATAAGVSRFVHVSAAGIEGSRATTFNRTKLIAEAVVKGGGLDWIILRPGLVLASAAYGGSALLRGLAAFPFVVPIIYPASIVQIVSADDIARVVARAVDPNLRARISVDLVHAEHVSLEQLVGSLRQWLGLAAAPPLHVPLIFAQVVAKMSDALGSLGWRSPTRTTTLEQLRLGVQGEADSAEREFGLRLHSLREILNNAPAGVQDRWFARCYFLKPVILAALALFWFLSGAIGLVVNAPDAVSGLTAAGIAPPLATGAVFAGSVLDIVLGAAVIIRRYTAWALQGMLVVTALYLAGATLLRPDLWLDPLGPLLKAIPAALLSAMALAILDDR